MTYFLFANALDFNNVRQSYNWMFRVIVEMLAFMVSSYLYQMQWGCSSVGRATALHAVGRRFDSCHLHH